LENGFPPSQFEYLQAEGSSVWVGRNGRLLGCIRTEDRLRPEAISAVRDQAVSSHHNDQFCRYSGRRRGRRRSGCVRNTQSLVGGVYTRSFGDDICSELGAAGPRFVGEISPGNRAARVSERMPDMRLKYGRLEHCHRITARRRRTDGCVAR
jgi:hypothetical protein